MRQHRNPAEFFKMRRRRRDARTMGADHHAKQPLNRWRKRHPLDCGNPKCGMCHPDKRVKPSRKRREAVEQAKEDG
jgi:hypothetical protein